MAEQPAYKRAEISGTDSPGGGRNDAAVAGRIRWSAAALAILLCVVQALLTLYASHRQGIYVTSTQISVVSFVILVVLVLGINPLLRRLPRIKPLGRAELIVIFATLAVTAGISTFGLADQLVPLIATPHNPKWATTQRGWNEKIIPFLDKRLYLQDEKQVVQFREGLDRTQSVWRNIPWGIWLGPLAHWLGFVAAGYGLFYFLTLVLYPQWAYREKLIFPLAKIPQELIPGDEARGKVPAILRTGVFWAGFLLPFCVHLWNGSIAAGWLHGVNPIPQALDTSVLRDTAFGSLLGAFKLSIFFAAVGIAFLLPPSVSFSIWFYFLVYNAMVFAACALGFGKTGADFPRDWIWTNNFLTAQGGGGIVAFGVICLFKALAGYREGLAGLAPQDRLRRLWPLAGLGASFFGMIWWMVDHLPAVGTLTGLFWVSIFVTLLTVITVSLMRVVAECGIFGYQSWTGPFHFAKMLNLPRVMGGAVIAPLLTFYSILFLDIKTFIAPAFMNAERMNDDSGATRFRFHLTLWLSILATVAASVLGSIVLAYRVGAQQMSSWFYSQATPLLLDKARKLVEWEQAWSPGHVVAAILGAVWVGLSVFLRRTLFWFPHPVGYIMFVNPLIRGYWFSFFLAWIVKTMVLKYGGRHTFERVKPFFIGLIIGEIMACAFWSVLAWALGLSGVRIDLNRNG